MTSVWEYVFDLPHAALLTSNQRPHWRVRKDRTAALRARGAVAGRSWPRTSLPRAHVTAVVAWPPLTRRRDAANLWPTVKPLIDGLVDAGVLPDDDDTHLSGPDWRVSREHAAPGHVRITLVFHPVDPAP